MADIAKVKEIMQECSMPLELTMAEFKEQTFDMRRDNFDRFSESQTKDDIINSVNKILFNTG